MVKHTFKSWTASAAAAGCLMAVMGACHGTDTAPQAPGGTVALRPIVAPASGDPSDRQRAMLARFVGLWSFEGWAVDGSGQRKACTGRAAAAIEKEHFVLVELRATAGTQLAGRSGRTSASLLFGSEPGVGVTLTAWGDASAAVSRLIGSADAGGATFTFREAPTPAGVHTAGMVIRFEGDDRWTAELRDADAGGKVVAAYTFTRAAN